MSSRLRSMIDSERIAPAERLPRKAVPAPRHYKAGLDPEAARILDMFRLGLDVAVGGPAGTGKSAAMRRLKAMALPTHKVETIKADGSATVEGAEDALGTIAMIDEAGLSAGPPPDDGVQVISTYDYLQSARLSRIPNWQGGRPERASEQVTTRISYRRKSNNSPPPPSEDGGAATLASPSRPTSEGGDPIRVHWSMPDPTMTAIAIAATAAKNANANPGVKQTIAIYRPQVLGVLRDILIQPGKLGLEELGKASIKFTHPFLIQGDEADNLILEVAGLDEAGLDDAMRIAGVIMGRASQQLDIILPLAEKHALSRGSHMMTRALVPYLALPYKIEPEVLVGGLSVPTIPPHADPLPILRATIDPQGIKVNLRGRPALQSGFAIADLPAEGAQVAGPALLSPSKVSEGRPESAIVEALESLHPISDPYFAQRARTERRKSERKSILDEPFARTSPARGKKEKRK